MNRLTPSPANQAALLGLDVNAIMWCDASRNPGVFGCQRISPACGTADNKSRCYAEIVAAKLVHMAAKMGQTSPYAGVVDADGWTGEVRLDADKIGPAFATLPKKAGARIRRIFVTSMGDLFHKLVMFLFLDLVFAEMAARPWLVFQVLTKRADRMAAYAADRTARGLAWPANVWAGVTVEDQRRADERIPHLLQVPAAVRFLSVEPMLGAIDLRRVRQVVDDFGRDDTCTIDALTGAFSWKDPTESGVGRALSWVIVGSESDGPRPGARETRDEWVLDLVDQCDAASVPVFCKQLSIDGRLCSLPMVDGRVRAEFPNA